MASGDSQTECSRQCAYRCDRGGVRKCQTCDSKLDLAASAKKKQCDECRAAAKIRRDNISHLRRTLRVSAQQTETVDKKKVFARDRYHCWICLGICKPKWTRGDPASPTLDHVIPISKGGSHSYDNCRCAHDVCNRMKNDG